MSFLLLVLFSLICVISLTKQVNNNEKKIANCVQGWQKLQK